MTPRAAHIVTVAMSSNNNYVITKDSEWVEVREVRLRHTKSPKNMPPSILLVLHFTYITHYFLKFNGSETCQGSRNV